MQVSFEYMITLIIILAFLLPIWVYVSGVQRDVNYELAFSYARNTVRKIANTADMVYSQGPPSKVTVEVFVPPYVESSNIANNTVSLNLLTESLNNTIFDTSRATMVGTLPITEGLHSIKIEAVGDYVLVEEVFD